MYNRPMMWVMNSMFAVFVVVLLVLGLVSSLGCIPPPPAPEHKTISPEDVRAIFAVQFALAGMDKSVGPAPPPTTKHARRDCPTDGWLTHGDGHRTRCKLCDPPWNDTGSVGKAPIKPAAATGHWENQYYGWRGRRVRQVWVEDAWTPPPALKPFNVPRPTPAPGPTFGEPVETCPAGGCP